MTLLSNYPTMRGIYTAVPQFRYSQEETFQHYMHILEQQGCQHSERAIRTIFQRAGIEIRHSVIEPSYFGSRRSTQERNERYLTEAVQLGHTILRCGLEQFGLQAQDIDTLIVVSCTGYSIPGLDLLLAAQLGMRPNIQRVCILGMGCYGAFPGIRQAMTAVQTHENHRAIVLALELCTLHIQFDDNSESVVSSALFADGGACVLIDTNAIPQSQPTPHILDTETYCDYQTLDQMSFTVTNEGFRMYLSSYVPDLLAANVSEFMQRLLARHQLQNSDIAHWAIHPGSKKIVEYIQHELELTAAQVKPSLDVLQDYGNMSSPTVLFVLDAIQKRSNPQVGDYGVLMAFGPGLTMEAILVQWDN
jgi:predicted naringenin-chalcone synthase